MSYKNIAICFVLMSLFIVGICTAEEEKGLMPIRMSELDFSESCQADCVL